MKKFVAFLLIALIHFGLSVVIMPITMSVAGTLNAAQSTSTIGLKTLVVVTRILHFPIISLSWYSRQWFPGNWIYIPIFFNSLVWGLVLYVAFQIGRKFTSR